MASEGALVNLSLVMTKVMQVRLARHQTSQDAWNPSKTEAPPTSRHVGKRGLGGRMFLGDG